MYRLNRTSRFFVCTITIVIMVLFAVLVGTNLLPLNKRVAHAATNNYLNFQARILTSNGGVVPDGMYNVEFKLYNQDSGGSALWTETWTGSNRIRTVNGYISTNLGSVNSFSSNINWDQELWITLNIGGTDATPSWDGEMNPRMKVTGVPYAIAAGKLQVTNGSYTSTLSLTAPTGGNQTFVLPNLASATSATVITTGNLNSINAVGTVASGTWNGSAIAAGYGGTGISSYATGDILYASDTTTLSRLAAGSNGYCLMSQGAGSAPVWAACAGGGAGAYIQNQFSAQQASSNFWISGTGRADTSFLTALLDTPTATALNVGTTNATQINLNKNVVVKGNTSDSSSTALTVTNSSDTALLTIRNDGLASFSGNVSVSGTYNSNTFTSSQLTFGAASATTVQSANNQNLTVRSQGSGTLTLGNGSSQFTLQGNQSSIITASNGSYTATVSFTNPVANVTYRFPALAEGTYDICTLGGNCLGNGDIIQGGNAYNATIVVGATDNHGLNLITNNTTRISVTNTGNIAMDTNTLYVDAVNHRVGIGNTSPSSLFSVGSSSQLRVDGSGNILTSGTYNANTFTSSSLIFGANSDSTIQAASNQGLTVRSQGTGTLTLGATAQQTTLQGSASSSIVIGNGTYTTTVDFTNPTANVVYRFPALGAGTYDICTSGNNCTGLGAYIQNQFSAQQAGSNFWISGTGRADTSFLSPLFLGSNAANGTITIQGNSASSGNTATSPNIQFRVGNSGATTAMTILNNGNVGIGTTTPSARLAVQGSTSDDLANALFVTNSGGSSNLFTIRNDGHIGIGTSANNDNYLYVISTQDASVDQWGTHLIHSFTPTQDQSTLATGFMASARKQGNYNLARLTGLFGHAALQGEGTIGAAIGAKGQISLFGASGQTGTITNGYALWAESPTRSAGSLQTITNNYGVYISNQGASYITNSYGLYLADQTGSTTNNYSIYSAGGLNYLAGNLGVGIAPSASANLVVAASTTSTASLRLTSSAGTNPSSPNSGDLWWNGTALNFYNGSSTINLLNNASGSFINNQNAAQQASSNFWISGTGRADTSFVTPLVDTASAGTLSLGTATATAITIGNATNNTPITLNSGTGTIAIGTGNQARAINIGTGTAAQTVTVGSTNTTSSLTLQAGSGGIVLNSALLTRTAAGTTTIDLVDGSNTTLALTNSGAGVANLSIDGNLTVAGTYNTNTFTSSNLTFGGAAAATIQSANNQNLTVQSQGTGTLTLGATAQQTTLQGSASSSIVIGNGTYTTTVDFTNPTANVVYRFPALGAGTYDICTSGNNCTGLGAYIQNQFSAQQAGSNFWISGTGRADTSFTTPLLTGINATSGSNGNGGNITISAGARDGSGTTGSVIVKPQTGNDSTTAFQVQNAAGTATVLNVDTTNQRIGVGTTSPTAKLDISGAGETTEGSLDSELVTNGTFTGNANGWTLNSGWSYSSNRIVHTPGSTDTATQSLSLSAGSYQVKYTVASRNAGTIRADLESRQGVTLSQNVTDFTEIITVYGNGSIAFVPSSDFDGAIDNVSVRRLNSSSALQVIRNSDNSIGLEVRSGGSGFYNTFLGVNAGSSTLHGSGYEGYYNTAIGYNALRFNTTGYSNTVLGYGSLQSNTTGYNNVAIGVQALINNTVGSSNVAIGESALMGNITGSGNVAIGAGALRSNITGGGNIAIGDGSLLSNTTGGGNIAIGQWALLGNTTGSSNIAIGWQAMKDNTTGTFNYAFGHQAAMSLTTGSGNVAFGIYAMGSNSTGESNASFGVDSMRYLASGSYNVGVGREALTGSFNGSNNTALGAYAGFGYTPNSVANTSVSAGGSVNVGTHYYKVTFVINGRETNPYTSWQSTSATTTTGNQTVNLSDIPTYSGPLAGGTIARRVYRTKLNDSNEYYLVGTINNNTTITYTDTLSDASLGSAYVGPSHSIMLGTSAKAMFSNQLVVGDGEWDNHISESYWGGGIFAANPQNFGFYGTSGSGTNVTGASLIFGAGRGTGSAAGGDIIFQTAAAGSSGSNINNLSEVMRITNTGRVSVGNIASPTAYLQVAASTTSTASLRLTSSAGTNPSSPNSGDLWWNGTALNFYNGSSTINLLNNASGSFINNQNAAQQASSNFWISGTGRADTSFLSPLFLGSNAANGTITIQGNSAASGNTADSPNIQFKVGNSGTTTAMTIVNNGGVVIGNPGSSAARLTIGGDGTRPGYIEGLSIINSTAQGREYFIGVQSNHNGGRLEIHDTWADSLRLVLDADGRFGIGGLYPQFDLHVGGAGIGMAETSFLSPAFDSPTASSALNIGTSNTNAITIGNAARNSSITLNSGTGTIAIGTGNQARTINIGTGTAAQTITVGSTNGASSLLLQSGTGALNIQTQGTGGINIGTNAVAQTVTIGNTTGASAVNLQAGSGNINLNSVTNMQVTSANAFRIQSASAADTMFTVNTSGNQVKIGNDTGTGSATTLLVLDSASSAPTGTAGAMYYNTTTGRIQCYENGSWGACGRTTLQEAYTFSAGAAPSIALNSTNRAFVLQNSATGTISGELFGVRANAVNDTTLGASLFSITSAGRLGINIGSNVQNPTVNYDLAFGQGVNRTIGVEASSGTTGYNLTVSAGNANGSGTAYAGGQISIQGGNAAGTGNAAGGNVYLTGGSGVGTGTKGLVIIDTPTFTTSARQDCASNCTITQANVDGTGAVIINATAEGLTISLPDPTNTTAGRIVYVTAYGSSNDFSLSVNGGGVGNLIAMRANTTATMVWNGSDWTAAGASSSTTLQAAYDNTLSSAGGAEIVLNNTATSNGLTVRNNASNPIIGDGLFEVQTSIGSNLFSVNNNAVEYASNGGAETQGASASTFPANTWSAAPAGGTVSRYTTQGDYIATGAASVSVTANAANRGAANRLSSALTPNLKYTVSYAVRGAVSFSTLDTIYSRDGTNTSTVSCATDGTVTTGVWTRISCTFTAPASGITASNAIFIRQSDATSRTFYIDNLSVTVSADVNHAADGSVDDSGSFTTNWTAFGASTTVARDTSVIYDTSGSARVDTPAATNRGIRNNLSITPQSNTQYLVSLYARSTVAMTGTDFTIRYSRDGGTNFVDCTDYNTRAIGTAGWTKVTCLFTTDGTAATNPDLIITQATSSTARSIYIDALTITLNTNTASNVQIGGGNNGGPVTLFTLDRSAGAPIAANNDTYLGSMYYDTVTGKIQCYEADGWGACGSAPDNIVNLNPEFSGAVLNGSGVGTMTADFCGNGGGLSVNTALCASGEARNFYRWNSPQATQQTYSIYVTYQLPASFKAFADDNTVQLTARRDSTNAAVTYEMYRSEGGSIYACGTETTVTTQDNVWQTVGINGNESTGCGFTTSSANAFVIFKINVKAQSNANAFVGTLTFTTTGR